MNLILIMFTAPDTFILCPTTHPPSHPLIPDHHDSKGPLHLHKSRSGPLLRPIQPTKSDYQQ